MADEKDEKKEQEPAVPACGLCRRPKVRRVGFGGVYECPNCNQSSGIGFGNK